MRFDKNTNYLGVDFYNHTCNTYQSKNKFRGERNWIMVKQQPPKQAGSKEPSILKN